MEQEATNKQVISVFWNHAKQFPILLSVSTVFRIAADSIWIITPLYYKKFFDTLTSGMEIRGDVVGSLIHIIVIILSISLLQWLLYRIANLAVIDSQVGVLKSLTDTAFKKLIRHSHSFFANSFSGSLVRKVNRLATAYERIDDILRDQITPLIVTTVGVFFVLFKEMPTVACALLVWVFLFLIANYFVAQWKQKYDIIVAEQDSKTTGVLADAIGNHEAIRSFSRNVYEEKLLENETEQLKKDASKSWKINEVLIAIQGLLIAFIEAVVLYISVLLWQKGILTVGDFVLVQSYILALIHRIWGFGNILRRIWRAFSDAREMVAIINKPLDIKDIPRAKNLTVKEGAIVFDDVSFSFHETRTVFKNLNLSISSKEKIALVGPSGAGKSTIVKLVTRLFDVDAGQINIDNQNIAKVTQESLRKIITVVPQEPTLFHRTIKENIGYGKLDATDEEIIQASKQAHCYEFITNLPDGYDTYVGERGVKLSGGERQRVAIARAILKNAPILILDEATSSLDSESESLIQDALHTLMRNKTVIVIAHRLSTIMEMDRIIVIDQGGIIAQGTHKELLEKDGMYQKLWNIQAGGFLE